MDSVNNIKKCPNIDSTMPFNYISMMKSRLHHEASSMFPDIDSYRESNKTSKQKQDL